MRRGLLSIVQVVLLCARQGIALRGKSDNLSFSVTSSDPSMRLGNFNAILKMKKESGDSGLEVN